MPHVHIDSQLRFSPEKMQKVGLIDAEHLFCDVYCLEPGQSQRIHTHADADKIYYVTSGTGCFTLGDAAHTLAPGNVIHAAAGEQHGVENPGPDRLTVLVIMAPNPNR